MIVIPPQSIWSIFDNGCAVATRSRQRGKKGENAEQAYHRFFFASFSWNCCARAKVIGFQLYTLSLLSAVAVFLACKQIAIMGLR